MNDRRLRAALAAYWAAASPREEQAAYHEILLFGGKDGYGSGWRSALARTLRRLALWIENGRETKAFLARAA